MTSKLTRRKLLTTAAVAVPGAAALAHLTHAAETDNKPANITDKDNTFSFPLLGDLHLDKLEHHDMEWLAREHPGDVRQVQNYSRISAEVHPHLFKEVREVVADLKARPNSRVPFVLHIGDFVEGLCGNRALAQKHNEDAIAFTRDAKLAAPFLFCKGNHDVTGPEAREAFNAVLLPFINEEVRREPQISLKASAGQETVTKAYYAVQHGNALFAFFDAYEANPSLDWLEKTLAASTARHNFVLIHPPAVPYGARATWHVFSKPNQTEQRTRLLNLLGQHKAIVLGGHIHKYNVLTRRTPTGRFVQLAVNSVIPKPEQEPSTVLEGVKDYTPEQIKVEPNFSPTTEAERRAALAAEAPFIENFEYADLPGYAVITVQGERVQAEIYKGLGRRLWKTLDLSAMLAGQSPKSL